jgi:hypothetical protein
MRFFASAILLTACSHHPVFERGDNGYTAKDTPVNGIVLIQLHLPIGVSPEITNDYLARAAGEECATRHFKYFDYAPAKRGDGRAFCYAEPEAPQLALTLDPKTLPNLKVEDMARGSPIHPGDVIFKVAGHKVRDQAELKETVYIAGKRGDHSVSVSVERSQIPFTLDCALNRSSHQINTPETLEELRTKIK